MKLYLTIVGILIQFATAEDMSIVLQAPSGPNQVESTPITLNQGDTAKLKFATASTTFFMRCNIDGKAIEFPCMSSQGTNPVTIAGPATISFWAYSMQSNYLATLRITRAGTASPPAAIPQEAGTKWDVILESSSDLINWTLANPGEYSGTEPKRFSRTRIVKKP